jgi:spore germination protein GerM
MTPKASKRIWKFAVAAAAFAAVVALVWGALSYRSTLRKPSPPEEEVAEEMPSRTPAEADIYFADAEYTELVPERREIGAADDAEERVRRVVTALVAGPRKPNLSPTLPADAQLKSVFLRDGVALLNFDERLQSKRFGSTGELFALNSLYRTVTANVDGVDGVVILINGRTHRTLAGEGGHVAAGFPIYGELGRYVYPAPEERRE